MDQKYRSIPSVDKLLNDEHILSLIETYSHSTVADLIREELNKLRLLVTNGNPIPTYSQIIDIIMTRSSEISQISLRRVINASGVILHTNLGRAPLSEDTIQAMILAATGFNNLEFDLTSGKRGSRQLHVEKLLCQITGAEAAFVVNNNAAAVLLMLTALSKKKEVIISRGQAVEIGGKFRIPDVMKQSGARLVDVGTTNRTYISDYKEAITTNTVALLRVHPSNFMTIGFTSEVSLKDLIALAISENILVFDDLGSGCILATEKYGLLHEPTIQESIKAGVSLTCFSGDKLLGGPQAGIIAGKKTLVDKLRNHPLSRAIRIDKIRIAGLIATLLHYKKNEAEQKIPVWQMISASLDEIYERAERWADFIGSNASTIHGESMIGAGSLPGTVLPTKLVAINVNSKRNLQELTRILRLQNLPIIGRIEKDTFLLDPRTVLRNEDDILLDELKKVLTGY